MAPVRSLPFRNLTREQWLNLLLCAILALFTFYFVWQVALRGLCGQIGADYCDYWSADVVAKAHGFPAMYDLDLLDEVQKGISPPTADASTVAVVPFPYLQVFVLPFLLLARLSPLPGFSLWSLLSIAAFWPYFHLFVRNASTRLSTTRTMPLLLASLPVFPYFYGGQLSVGMAICVAEFMRSQKLGHAVRSGIWLGGLLIMPHALVLIAPSLVRPRAVRDEARL